MREHLKLPRLGKYKIALDNPQGSEHIKRYVLHPSETKA